MRLTRFTDYAVRVLFHAGANPGRAVPVSEIARTHGISQNHLVKVVHGLVKAGFLASQRGRSGGIMLARPAGEISLGDVVRETEPDLRLIDCMGCAIASHCALPGPLHEAVAAFLAVLDRHSLADLVASSHGLEGFLGPGKEGMVPLR